MYIKMRKRTSLLYGAFAALLFLSARSYGQEIPSLPQDPKITRGVLPDGMSYYLAENKTVKGMTEYTLVQRLRPGETYEFADSLSKVCLGGASRFGVSDVRKYMARKNAVRTYRPRRWAGPVEIREDAVVYRLGAVSSSAGETAVDSTLLMLFGMADRASAAGRPVSSHAIIISGDIDRAAMRKKIEMLSMMLPADALPPVRPAQYEWNPVPERVCEVESDTAAGYSSIKVSYASPRTPQNMTGTVLPVVSERLGDIMGTLLKKRIHAEMKRGEVPLAFAGYGYERSTEQPGDERYSVTVRTGADYAEKAAEILGGVLSDMDTRGVLPSEYSEAKSGYQMGLYEQSLAPVVPNGAYADMCISSFLYGAGMPSKEAEYNFFVRDRLADSSLTRMFNRFAAELLDSSANLTISARGGAGISENGISKAFADGWKTRASSGNRISYVANRDDVSALPVPSEKIKANAPRKEPVSGGELWKFSNGMTVVYKRMNTGGLFYYTMVIRGGYSSIPDMRPGEGAFLSDMLRTYDICGIKPDAFSNLLLSEGITMSAEAGLSDLKISGRAPRPSLETMLRALAALANGRSADVSNAEYYMACEKIRLESLGNTVESRLAAIDSLMYPSYSYSSVKTAAGLYPDMQERAAAFFDSQFSRVNDGVFIIVGDMEETAMRKLLSKNLGMFRTNGSVAASVQLSCQPISGWTTHTSEGGRTSVDVAMSVPMQFTADNYMASRIAASVLQGALDEALCDRGVAVRVSSELSMYPQERLSLVVSVEEENTGRGNHADALDLLSAVREVLSGLSANPVSAERLKICKAILADGIASRQNDPQYWMSVVTARYADGKDLNTKYADKISGVSSARIKEIISSLSEGSKVEYVIQGK